MTLEGSALSPAAELRRTIATTLLPGFFGTTLPDWLAERLRNGLGGVCVFGQNIVSIAQLRELTDAIRSANPRAVVAIDEEGGDVTRLYYDSGSLYPGAAVLGRSDDLAYTEHIGRLVGWELRRAGCTLNFAPDADINSNQDNPVIGVRSFGSDPALVAAHAAAWTRGHQSTGVAVSAKHFPGHGDTAQDSHLDLPVVDIDLAQLWDRELVPFRAAIAAGARSIMTSHILIPRLDPNQPATLSRRILQGLLREELRFDGVIVSDALDMRGASGIHGIPEAAVRALDAGCDLLCIGTENTDEQLGRIEQCILDAVVSGRLDEARVRDAADRVLRLAADAVAAEASIPVPDAVDTVVDPDLGVDRAIATFDLSPRARRWLDEQPTPAAVIRIETVANLAIGVAPWGPFAETAQDPASVAGTAWEPARIVSLSASDVAPPLLSSGPVVIVGRNIHRYDFARGAVDRLRAGDAEVLVVDMGWPSDDRAYADIATFGASRLIGRALLDRLDHRSIRP
ncbi:beta-N-acetylhexosaminidase [Luethyella okanaganae]|uniref:Beta-N-acetylhexosaminidase n=1 Tax=Luethyella okanaganae TaxID=69372 RepID=A0ABW1VHK2_9MICO